MGIDGISDRYGEERFVAYLHQGFGWYGLAIFLEVLDDEVNGVLEVFQGLSAGISPGMGARERWHGGTPDRFFFGLVRPLVFLEADFKDVVFHPAVQINGGVYETRHMGEV